MWKKEDARPQGVPDTSAGFGPGSGPASTSFAPAQSSSAPPVSGKATACISQGIKIKGEITGSEDLFVDGPVEGKVHLANGSLTVGPNGFVKADVTAREVIVRGRVEGKIAGRERVQLWSTGQVIGEVQTERLAIEDGAVLRGKVETGRPQGKADGERSPESSGAKATNGVSVGSGSQVI
jgi:cytoskeletal protein CcmA (bactofilin family)